MVPFVLSGIGINLLVWCYYVFSIVVCTLLNIHAQIPQINNCVMRFLFCSTHIYEIYIFFSPPLYRSHVLSKVCQYFTYKVRYTNSSTEIPEFPISREIALELLMAANFLDC